MLAGAEPASLEESQVGITGDMSGAEPVLSGESEVTLYPRFLTPTEAAELAHTLTRALNWERLVRQMYGKVHLVRRETCWVGPVTYRYGSIRHPAAPWPDVLLPLRDALEAAIDGAVFATVLANRYCNGHDKVDWHADDEPLFGSEPVIASVSLGATRAFELRNNATRVVVRRDLGHGGLLVMRGLTQQQYQHRVPVQEQVAGERINLTFRTLGSHA